MEAINSEKTVPTVTYLQEAYDQSADTIGSKPAESLALLVGNPLDNVVQKIIFDSQSENTRSTTTLNTAYLNPQIKKMWQDHKLRVIGVEHSQPGLKSPSQPDLDYFAQMSKALNLETMVTPILFTTPDGGFKVFPYIYHRATGKVEEAELLVLSASAYKRQNTQHMNSIETTSVRTEERPSLLAKTKKTILSLSARTSQLNRTSFHLLITLFLILIGWVLFSITPSLIIHLTEALLP